MNTDALAAAQAIRQLGGEIGRQAVDRQYAIDPQLSTMFGERGYRKSLEDAAFNIEHLAEAVALESPSAFVDYVVG